MPIINQMEWDKCVRINTDPYGKCCVDVARKVMELLDADQTPLHEGYHPDINTPHGLICKADREIDADGITGFMAGCVAQMVALCHSRGEEFRKIWNKELGVPEDSKGVANPAILTLEVEK